MENLGVCIPCHVTNTFELSLLIRALESIRIQTLQPQEIVLSDDTKNGSDLLKLVEMFPSLNMRVVKNTNNEGIAKNSNFGVSQLRSDWVHVLHQDDWLSENDAYELIMQHGISINSEKRWILVAGTHEDGSIIVPKWTESVVFGFNSIGGPSCLFVRRKDFINLDSKFTMMVDVKNYYEYHKQFGSPLILSKPLISYGDPLSRVSRNTKTSQVMGELNAIVSLSEIETIRILGTIRDAGLNPFHRSMVLKCAKENKKIGLYGYIYLSLKMLFSRMKLKIVFND